MEKRAHSWTTNVAAAAAVASIASCDRSPANPPGNNRPTAAQAAPSQGGNLYNDVLKGTDFMGQDGKSVNLVALQAALKDRHVTLSFGFSSCLLFCPVIDQSLAHLGEMAERNDAKLTTIIIAVDPENDGDSQETRKNYLKKIKESGVKQDVIILYPRNAQGELDKNASVPVANRAGRFLDKSDPTNSHSPFIMLYAPDGRLLDYQSGMNSENFKHWATLMSSGKKQGR